MDFAHYYRNLEANARHWAAEAADPQLKTDHQRVAHLYEQRAKDAEREEHAERSESGE